MARVKHRPAFLVAILLYVTLDLSLPAMPGAFVFDAGDSVECTHGRARAGGEAIVLPAPAGDVLASCPLRPIRVRLAPHTLVQGETGHLVPWPRAFFAPPASSEDPH